ncbi:hypothetical protein COI89_10865 [Bacillus cereus]|nr:hypothetical protein COI89_10865 [Bacillus cereus]
MKKILIGFVSFATVLVIGSFTESYSPQADHGRPPAPAKPDFALVNFADGNTGVAAFDHGRPTIMANLAHGETI